jgi:adenine-specific DNA-methyltransferase
MQLLQEELDAPTRAVLSPLCDHLDTILHGDCCLVMQHFPDNSIDLVFTDPPYLINYHPRDGRSIAGDTNDEWLRPAFFQAYRVLKVGGFCISFYSSNHADSYLAAWREAGFRPVGHVVWVKSYAASSAFLQYRHEQAYLLAKGFPKRPRSPISDVQDWQYSGNRLHPTQKPVGALLPLVRAFSRPGEVVLDPFCGSGSVLLAAKSLGRRYIGIELREDYWAIAQQRLQARRTGIKRTREQSS